MGYSVEFVDGWYQVIDRDKSVHSENGDTNGGHRLAATEQFINGSPDIVLCGVVEDMLNIMQDTMTGVAKSSCGTVDGRAAAVVLADRLHLSIDTLFDPPESILLMMESVLGVVKDSLGRLDGDTRKDYVRFVSRHLIRTYDNMVGYNLKYGRREKVVAGFTFDDFMFEVMVHGGSFLDRLEKLGIGIVIDEPEDVLDPDVGLTFMMMEDSFKNINIGFALVTRPSDLGLREALKTLPRMLSTGISRHFSSKGMLTWRTLAHDWEADGMDMVLRNGFSFAYAHAVTLMLEDGKVVSDKVDIVLGAVFPSWKGVRGLSTIRRRIPHRTPSRFDWILTAIIGAASDKGDMELLKALAWIVLLSDKVLDKDGGDIRCTMSYGSLMAALDQYNDGLPWAFIAETMKASLRGWNDGRYGAVASFNEVSADGNSVILKLVDYPQTWLDGKQES